VRGGAATVCGGGWVGSLGLSMQDSGGWASLPATTRPPQRVQPETAQARITRDQPANLAARLPCRCRWAGGVQ
jgi:hypothetical protein